MAVLSRLVTLRGEITEVMALVDMGVIRTVVDTEVIRMEVMVEEDSAGMAAAVAEEDAESHPISDNNLISSTP